MGPGAPALQSSGALPRQRRRVELTPQGCSGPPARGEDFPGLPGLRPAMLFPQDLELNPTAGPDVKGQALSAKLPPGKSLLG